jgi:hypothetical protein
MDRVPEMRLIRLYLRLGGRVGVMMTKFIVQDGVVVRSGVYALTQQTTSGGQEFGNILDASVYSVDHVAQEPDLEGNTQIPFASHPYYSVDRPGGCEGCLAGWVRYSDVAPQSVVQQLNGINVDCFRVGARCMTIEELLPSSDGFELYDESEFGRPRKPSVFGWDKYHGPCDVPVWARARDAFRIVAAQGLRTTGGTDGPGGIPSELDRVKVLDTLKGRVLGEGAEIEVRPYDPRTLQVEGIAEHIKVGERVFLLSLDPPYQRPDGSSEDLYRLDLDRCSVVPDSADARKEIARGLSANDNLHGPELSRSVWSF